MKSLIASFAFLGLVSVGSYATAQTEVFFEETFDGPTLDPSVWRTEILTSGPRWCPIDLSPWAPGEWVDEGEACHGIPAYSPYGSVTFSDGLMYFSSTNERAFPSTSSRLPGSVQLFPSFGDFTLKVRMRYDRVTPWGDGVVVFQTETTEPVGSNPPAGLPEHVLLQLACDNPGGGIQVVSALSGSLVFITEVPPATDFHEIVLECVGTSFTISADGQMIYGPVASALRPTAVEIGNPVLAFWYPTDWTSFSIDYLRVEIPSVPAAERSWGAVKATYR